MSSYFVNSLALCYSDGVADSGGPQQQTQQSTQREYRHGSPYRSYPASHPARHHAYPYRGDVDSKCHDDFYVNERSAPQRASSRTTSDSPPTDSSMSTAAGPTDYSPTAAIYRASHMSPTTEVPARRTTASPPPPSLAPSPPPKQTTQSRSPSPIPASQESPTQQPTSTPIPTQIFPWMRRMHLGHGKLLLHCYCSTLGCVTASLCIL